ncbi:hypothetical protein F4777DRAFT_599491 [Nemania sp. FL0916]|nr:hypothetical protein F4777DRAFT_599491 [Nemania sp. FL0916]
MAAVRLRPSRPAMGGVFWFRNFVRTEEMGSTAFQQAAAPDQEATICAAPSTDILFQVSQNDNLADMQARATSVPSSSKAGGCSSRRATRIATVGAPTTVDHLSPRVTGSPTSRGERVPRAFDGRTTAVALIILRGYYEQRPFATPGPYIRRRMLLALATRFGSVDAKAVERWMTDNGFETPLKLTNAEATEAARRVHVAVDAGGSLEKGYLVALANELGHETRLRERPMDIVNTNAPHKDTAKFFPLKVQNFYALFGKEQWRSGVPLRLEPRFLANNVAAKCDLIPTSRDIQRTWLGRLRQLCRCSLFSRLVNRNASRSSDFLCGQGIFKVAVALAFWELLITHDLPHVESIETSHTAPSTTSTTEGGALEHDDDEDGGSSPASSVSDESGSDWEIPRDYVYQTWLFSTQELYEGDTLNMANSDDVHRASFVAKGKYLVLPPFDHQQPHERFLKLELLLELETLQEIEARTNDFFYTVRSEDAWNEAIHGRMLKLALGGFKADIREKGNHYRALPEISPNYNTAVESPSTPIVSDVTEGQLVREGHFDDDYAFVQVYSVGGPPGEETPYQNYIHAKGRAILCMSNYAEKDYFYGTPGPAPP